VEECLDLTQETFLRVYKGLRGYRGDAPFGAWLYRIAGNVLRRHAARRPGTGSRPRQVPLEEAQQGPSGSEAGAGPPPAAEPGRALAAMLGSERRRLLRRAVAELPEQRRRCIVLWAYHELTYEQIAVALQLSIGTVKAHLAQARKQLETLVVEESEAGE
jgi:RNA polymerase sigma-70 factor (ECF subfamily)